MSLTCPICKDPVLEPVRIEDDLPAQGCSRCGGSLLSLVSYRNWRDHAAPAAPDDSAPRPGVTDAASALQCPKCDRLMTKYRFAADARNHIDLCGHCDEVWLDHGEWEMLERFAMTDKLSHVFTQPWQNRVRSDAAKRRVEERWREKLGADYEKARELRAWLATHPEGKELLAYLYLSQTS
jgi:Zn-finger nucleic acid-binding protein